MVTFLLIKAKLNLLCSNIIAYGNKKINISYNITKYKKFILLFEFTFKKLFYKCI